MFRQLWEFDYLLRMGARRAPPASLFRFFFLLDPSLVGVVVVVTPGGS